ncbi:MAG: apolipoprotein N-acyltransferase [Planctomycetes bacterium]|nr:apolipoprotein N-acyltransferase [Planctomycetota bacterium]
MKRVLFHLQPFVSAALLWLSFHPIDLGLLAWVALAPLIAYAVRDAKGWRVFLVSWLAGWAHYAAAFSWLYVTAPAGPFLLAIYKGLYFAFFALLVRVLTRRMPLALSAPAVWVALEYVRAHLFTGLPWFLLAYSQHEIFYLVQCSDLLGPWLVSALVVLVNAAVARGMILWGSVLMRDAQFRATVAAAASAVTLAVAYGWYRVRHLELEDGPRIAVIQPNIPQEAKRLSIEPEERQRIFDKHVALTRQVCAAPGKRDLVIWPESVIYKGLVYLPASGQYVGDLLLDEMAALSKEVNVPILFGSEVDAIPPGTLEDPVRWEYTNSAALVDGERGLVYRYDKNHLVMFSEKIPKLPLVGHFTEKYTGYRDLVSFKEGTRFNLFEAKGCRIGTAICFEAAFPEIAREIAGNGGLILVNISNEGWFKGTAELDQMFVMSRFRAIESRIAVVRGTNTGISGVIEPTGRVAARIPGKQTEGTLDAVVRVHRGGTLYGRVGDALAWAACALVAGALAWAAASRLLTARKGPNIVGA